MAKLYYEHRNRLRMENKTRSAKVLSLIKQCGGIDISIIDNEVAHTSAASAHITIGNTANKSHSLRNIEEFRVAEDDAENFTLLVSVPKL